MISVHRRLRGSNKCEKVGDFNNIETADDVVTVNNDGGMSSWLYFREETSEEKAHRIAEDD